MAGSRVGLPLGAPAARSLVGPPIRLHCSCVGVRSECTGSVPSTEPLERMDERLEPEAQIKSNCRKPPALDSEKDVAIPAQVQARESSTDQHNAKLPRRLVNASGKDCFLVLN
jgi:hypothetical protein